MATTRPPLTTRDDLQIPQAPTEEKSVLRWLQDFVTQLKSSFRLHAHLFPAVISGELKPNTYTGAALPPAAAAGASAIAYVSDGAVGTKFRGSDGAAWVNLDAAGGGGGGDNITVNGVAVADADFDDATPAAPGSAVNVKFQKDAASPANISAYIDAATTAAKGVVELATDGEDAAGVAVQGDDDRLSFARSFMLMGAGS